MAIALAGAVFGALLVAVLAPVGSRTGVPSMIAARAPLGYRGAQIVSGLLYLTNFAWIAVNNQIAASACAQVLGGPGQRAHLGGDSRRRRHRRRRARSTRGRLCGSHRRADDGDRRQRCSRTPCSRTSAPSPAAPASPVRTRLTAPLFWGLDVVIGYQVSWLLMFADYSRYTRSGRAAATAVFAGLAVPALWLMPVGWSLARIAGSDDPGTMLAAAGRGLVDRRR